MSFSTWLPLRAVLLRRRQWLIGAAAAAALIAASAPGLATTAVLGQIHEAGDAERVDPRRVVLTGLADYRVHWYGLRLAQSPIQATHHATVLVVPAGQENPTRQALHPSGASLEYTDAQSHAWQSVKYTYLDGSREAWGAPIQDVVASGPHGRYNYMLQFDPVDLGGTEFDLYVDADLQN